MNIPRNAQNELVLELQHFRWTHSVWQFLANQANQLMGYTYIYINIYKYINMYIFRHMHTYTWESQCFWSQLLHRMSRLNLRSPQDTTALSVLPCCSSLELMLLGQKKVTVLVVCWLLFSFSFSFSFLRFFHDCFQKYFFGVKNKEEAVGSLRNWMVGSWKLACLKLSKVGSWKSTTIFFREKTCQIWWELAGTSLQP